MQRNRTNKQKPLIAIQARIEPELVEHIDRERLAKGRCSRAVIIRQVLMERYRVTPISDVA